MGPLFLVWIFLVQIWTVTVSEHVTRERESAVQTEAGIDVTSITTLFYNPGRRKGSVRREIADDEAMNCYCQGFINGHFHAKAHSLEELQCESGSWVKCPREGGCVKNTYTVRSTSFVIKFCGHGPVPEVPKCTLKMANSAIFGSVELDECRCIGNLCNKSNPSTDTGRGSGVKWLVATFIVLFRLYYL